MNNRHKTLVKSGSILLTLLIILGFSYSSNAKDVSTRPLFLQSKYVNIEFPPKDDGGQSDGSISEIIDYKHADNRYQEEFEDIQGGHGEEQVAKIADVEVIGVYKSNFTPERDGRVNVDFVIRIPKEMISDDWRMTISPTLQDNDSLIALQDVEIRGYNFYEKQLKDYDAYDKYIRSIVDLSDYDSVFIDNKSISSDIYNRQEFYWAIYEAQWKELIKYDSWRKMMEKRYAHFNYKNKSSNINSHNKKLRKAIETNMRRAARGKSYQHPNQIYANHKASPEGITRELTEKQVPKKYLHFFRNNMRPEDITNSIVTMEDSLFIAKHRYFYDDIAQNEIRNLRREEMKALMVPFQYNTNARVDSVVMDPKEDMLVYYSQDYAVRPGLRKLQITVTGRVVSTDHSSYILAQADTLSYMISSLSQLADTTYIVKKTKLYRNMFDKLTIYPKFETNKSVFNINYSDNRAQMTLIMDKYRSFIDNMGLQLDSLEMKGSSSLEGTYETNAQLSKDRVAAVRNYMINEYEDFNDANVKSDFVGEDWNTLVRLLRNRTDITHRDEILKELVEAEFPDQTEDDIKKKYKADYKIIYDSIYPMLRKIDFVFNISQPNMEANDSTVYEVREGYEEGINLLRNGEYWDALEILADFGDYNAALALTCLGYNGKAYDLLKVLPQTANTEYLLAIVASRIGKKDEAVGNLLKACELSSLKVFRSKLDPEIIDLVREYNLQPQIDAISARR